MVGTSRHESELEGRRKEREGLGAKVRDYESRFSGYR